MAQDDKSANDHQVGENISIPATLRFLNATKVVLVIAFFVIGIGTVYLLSKATQQPDPFLAEYTSPEAQEERLKAQIDSYAECIAYGYPVIEGYPRQCVVPDGDVYTKAIEEPVSAVPDKGVITENGEFNSYSNQSIQFSFDFPSPWELYEETNFYTGLRQPTTSITIGDGEKFFAISAHYSGGLKEVCNPRPGDELHSVEAACATIEILDFEQLEQTIAGRPFGTTENSLPLMSYILERKLTYPTSRRVSGVQYQVCLLFDSRTPVIDAEFGVGRTPPPSPIVRNTSPEVFYLESCAFSDEANFLNSDYAETVRDIYRSLVVVE